MRKEDKNVIIEKIIEENLDYLVRFAFYRLRNKQDAEDIVYDAVLKFLKLNTTKINNTSLRLYLFKIVYNLCIDKMKRQSVEYVPINEVEIHDNQEIIEEILPKNIWNMIEKLHYKESEIIVMRVLDELSFVEISRILSVPQSTVKSRYKAGMDKLREMLKQNK